MKLSKGVCNMTGVYYSDLFVINGKGCLIMGFGKSKTCRFYTGEDTVEICSDSIRLEKNEKKLFGYADPTMGMLPFNKENAKNSQIHYLVRMLDEEETNKLGCKNIVEVNKEYYKEICDFNITYFVNDEHKRREEFASLIEDIELCCIMVPWCIDMETKGRLIKEYII